MASPLSRRLVPRLSRHFEPVVRRRGQAYFAAGHVDVTAKTATSVNARVQGSERSPYDVSLAASDSGKHVLLGCSCPHAARGAPCKHMWALVLAADVRGMGPRFDAADFEVHAFGRDDAPQPDPHGWRDADDDDAPWDDADDDDAGESVEGDDGDEGDATPPSHAKTARRPPGTTWRERLMRIEADPERAEAFVPDAAGRLEYHLDERSRLADKVRVWLVWRARRRDGRLGVPSARPLGRDLVASFSPEDRHAVAQLEPLVGSYDLRFYPPGYAPPMPSSIEVPAALSDLILPRLAATGRLYVSRFDGARMESSQDRAPLAWDGDAPYDLVLVIEPDAHGANIRGVLVRGDERLDAETFTPWTEHLLSCRARLVRVTCRARWCNLFAERPHIARRDLPDVLGRLVAQPDLPAIACDGAVIPIVTDLAPRPVVRCAAPDGRGDKARLGARVAFVYGGAELAARDPASGAWDRDGERLVRRDRRREAELVGALAEAGFSWAPAHEQDADIAVQDFPDAVRRLLDAGWCVEAEGQPVRGARAMSFRVSSGVDWFDVSASAAFDDGTIDPRELFGALSRGSRWVRLTDGSRGLLPEDWIDRFAPLAQQGRAVGTGLRFDRVQGIVLDALLTDRTIAVDAGFAQFRRQLARFERIAPRKAPRAFVGRLRPYQEMGLGWLSFLEEFGLGGCLADDMGLGKTVQVLALLARRRRAGVPRASLVVAPRSLVFNWREEVARFAPGLTVVDYRGEGRQALASRFGDCDLVLTTYGTLRRDVLVLKQHRFRYAILDEATAIKNATSQSAKACRLVDADHRLALTGTPVENRLLDLASLLEFLNPGMLARSNALAALAAEDPSVEDRSTLARALRPILLRRTKEQVLPDLPEKTEQTLRCRFERAQRRFYDEIRDAYRISLGRRIADRGMAQSKIHVLEALLRLRQVACHPGLVDSARAGDHSAKLEELVERLTEVVTAGHKALVFSQFTSFLALVRERLDGCAITYAYLDGRTRHREAVVRRFQDDPGCPVFLISLKAGGHGLNLTAADYVFLLDPWWNPAVEAQAIARSHRIGQSRPVFAYRLVCEDTIEDKILALQAKKRELAAGIFASDETLIASLDASDVAALLS